MNKIRIEPETGFPVKKKTFTFMQDAYTEAIKHLCLTFGDELILHGVELQGSERSEGAIVHNGELIPFERCTDGSYIVIEDSDEPVTYENGAQVRDYVKRVARCSTAQTANSFPLSALKRVGEKLPATEWELAEIQQYVSGSINYRVDDDGKGIFLGYIAVEQANDFFEGGWHVAKTNFRPKRRQSASFSAQISSSDDFREVAKGICYVDTDGSIFLDNSISFYTWRMFNRCVFSAVINLD